MLEKTSDDDSFAAKKATHAIQVLKILSFSFKHHNQLNLQLQANYFGVFYQTCLSCQLLLTFETIP